MLGFKEKRGPNETTHNYEVGSSYSQRALQRLIRTTGVCWYFPETSVMSEAVASCLLETFCREFAVQPRDLGIGRFHVQQSPLGTGKLQGICIFDATHGSLRLTERLGEHFKQIVRLACDTAQGSIDGELANPLITSLRLLNGLAEGLTSAPVQSVTAPIEMSEWIEVIAPNEKALLVSGTEATEVTVLEHFFTPQGLRYHLKSEDVTVRWTIEASLIQPASGITRMQLYNPNTGEVKTKD